MKFKKLISAFLLSCLLITMPNITAFADNETSVYHINSINGTRWQDYLCVYQNREHTGQNQWGYDILVNSEGIIIEKIDSGDVRGENLPIPEGGFVVSGTGAIAKEMFHSVEVGQNCFFDDYGMQVYFSSNEINPFYTKSISITGFNSGRLENTVIVYNLSGNKTGTNVWGYEVCVDSEGYIISSGGNNNVVPEKGYVISAINAEDKALLEMYFTVGAKCELSDTSVTVTYGKEQLSKTVENEIALVQEKIEIAKSQYKLLDYNKIETELNNIKTDNIRTLKERNAVIKEIQVIYPMLVEKRSVETRSVWYEPTEKTADDVKKSVAAMKKAGINELVLCVNAQSGTLVPVDTNKLPFQKDPVTQEVDILQTYVDECKANNISIVFWTPVFSGAYVDADPEWMDITNTGQKGRENFLSPANEDFRKVYMDYIRFIIDTYDIDGLQLDYIRYAQFYNNVDSGYDAATIKLFEEQTGYDETIVHEIKTLLNQHSKWGAWRDFKIELVNSWVSEIYEIVNENHPEIYVSAAVAGSNNKAYCQDPSAWIKGGYIDGIYVMSYSEEINETSAKPFLSARGNDTYLVMGCGAYLSISNLSLIEQTDNSNILGTEGTAYFEWSAVEDHGYTEILENSLFTNDAIPFTADVNMVVNRLVATTKERISMYCNSTTSDKATELKDIISSLPDTGADKDTLTAVLSKLEAALDDDVEKYLLNDIRATIRAINVSNKTYEPTEENSNESVDTNSSTEAEQSTDLEKNDKEDTSAPIIIGICVLLILASMVVIMIVLNNKKQSKE